MSDIDEKMNELVRSLAADGPEIEIEGQFVPSGYIVTLDGVPREVAEFVVTGPLDFPYEQQYYLRSFDGDRAVIHDDLRVYVEQIPDEFGAGARFVSAS